MLRDTKKFLKELHLFGPSKWIFHSRESCLSLELVEPRLSYFKTNEWSFIKQFYMQLQIYSNGVSYSWYWQLIGLHCKEHCIIIIFLKKKMIAVTLAFNWFFPWYFHWRKSWFSKIFAVTDKIIETGFWPAIKRTRFFFLFRLLPIFQNNSHKLKHTSVIVQLLLNPFCL